MESDTRLIENYNMNSSVVLQNKIAITLMIDEQLIALTVVSGRTEKRESDIYADQCRKN